MTPDPLATQTHHGVLRHVVNGETSAEDEPVANSQLLVCAGLDESLREIWHRIRTAELALHIGRPNAALRELEVADALVEDLLDE